MFKNSNFLFNILNFFLLILQKYCFEEKIYADFFKSTVSDALPLDGLYLPMHGAMFVEGMQDAEGDWYGAARKLVGPKCLMSASYDLHGNISKKIIDNLDMLSAFRTAPHIDREETMTRACDMLVKCLSEKIRPTLMIDQRSPQLHLTFSAIFIL